MKIEEEYLNLAHQISLEITKELSNVLPEEVCLIIAGKMLAGLGIAADLEPKFMQDVLQELLKDYVKLYNECKARKNEN